MNIRLLITALGLLICNLSFGQNEVKYAEFVKEAMKLYSAKEYKSSCEQFTKAFDQLDGKARPNDRYNAACSFALAADVENSFYHLLRLAKAPSNYSNYGHITIDTDLNILHKDKRWEELLMLVKANKEEVEKDYDKPLVTILDEIYKEDQSYRMQISDIKEQYGYGSDEMNAHWELINYHDSINLIKIQKILDERGWLGADVIGGKGNTTLFLVIQHADLETQLKYLPMMREAMKKGNARGSSLALLEDRVALRQGERQIYGSQIGFDKELDVYYVSPLLDPENVDERRKKVGLGPLADYVSRWEVNWDVAKHKERTAKIEETKKKMESDKK